MNPRSASRCHCAGWTVIDALIVIAVGGLILTVALPVLSNSRDDARVQQCADHQRQLAAATLKYAEDFEGQFFYHWSSNVGPDGEFLPPEMVGGWYDRKRIGRYLNGEDMLLRPPGRNEGDPPTIIDAGLGGGLFVCPADLPDAARSYGMNYWATTGLESEAAERRKRESRAWARRNGLIMPPYPTGKKFSASVENADQVFLFTDAFESVKAADGRWVTGGTIGIPVILPGERFGGRKDNAPGVGGDPEMLNRYRVIFLPTQLDYARHGQNVTRNAPVGALVIAFVDGHTQQIRSTELFDQETKKSTYKVLWSEIDKAVENPLLAD